MNNYMITSKDLDYLSDMHQWNFNICKFLNNGINLVSDDDMKNLFTQMYDEHKEILNSIINIMKG